MLSVQLIRRLHKRLCQVLAVFARVVTSSTQRLRILLFCFRRVVANIGSLPGHSKDSRSSECTPGSCSVLTGASRGGCSQATFPLPLHNRQVTSATAVNSTQDVIISSLSPSAMAIPPIGQSTTPPRMSLNAEANNPVSSNDSRVNFTPVCASNDLRHENRRLAYVLAAFYHDIA